MATFGACATTQAPKGPGSAAHVDASRFELDTELYVCPKIAVSNRPKVDAQRKIINYRPTVKILGKVDVAVAPQNGACLTSGFGRRGRRDHFGVDFQGKPAPMIHAAAAGTVLEAKFRKAYGNVVLIDHGDGVSTRYAHLERFERGIKPGAKVVFGAPLGVMGRTSKYEVPLHLHYEVLTGDYNTPKKSFGLEPVNLFALLGG